jgi:Mg2+/Co2+ transporter CorC
MTQIKIFTETTYSNPADKKVMTTGGLEKKVNEFLTENANKIAVKDIKYSIQSPNPHQILNLSVQHWTVMVIYNKL